MKEQKEQKVNSEKSLKRKTEFEELKNLKRHKTVLQNIIDNIRKSFECETLEACKEQNKICRVLLRLLHFFKSVIEKEKTLKDLEHAQEKIKKGSKNK